MRGPDHSKRIEGHKAYLERTSHTGIANKLRALSCQLVAECQIAVTLDEALAKKQTELRRAQLLARRQNCAKQTGTLITKIEAVVARLREIVGAEETTHD